LNRLVSDGKWIFCSRTKKKKQTKTNSLLFCFVLFCFELTIFDSSVAGDFIFDGMSLYAQRRFEDIDENVEAKFGPHHVVIKFTTSLDTAHLPDHVAQLFNVIFGRCFRAMGMVPIQRKYFYPKQGIKIDRHGVSLVTKGL
jgi:hypothetical protein